MSRLDSSPLLILTILTVFFFGGGVLIEWIASDTGLKNIMKDLASQPEQLKQAIEYQQAKLSNLHKASTIAFDLAKISLGAVVAFGMPTIQKNSSEQKNA
jgi:hypothetical protein